MKKPWKKEKEFQVVRKEVINRPRMSFIDYLNFFFGEGFGWLILGLVAFCALAYFFGGKR